MISYGKQTISEDDINAVLEALKSDFLTQGSKVAHFEASKNPILVLNIAMLCPMVLQHCI